MSGDKLLVAWTSVAVAKRRIVNSLNRQGGRPRTRHRNELLREFGAHRQGSSGFEHAVAHQAQKARVPLILVGRDAVKLGHAAKTFGGSHHTIAAEVHDPGYLARLVDEAGVIDHLVSMAGERWAEFP